ncbi:MAG: hypothetical protein HPY54_10615 [Chthonomonadetes bacterium]|nr:hypothetical protein [Chthonomonadetes bacterium]
MEVPRGLKTGCLGALAAAVLAVVLFVRWWTAPIDIPRPQRPPEPADNAYEVYRSLAAYTAQMSRTDPWLSYAERGVFPTRFEVRTNLPELHRYLLQKMAPVREEYRRYLHKPCTVIVEYSPDWQIPEIVEFRRWANVEALDIALAAQEGDFDRAIDNYRTVLLLSEQIRRQGLIINYLVGLNMQEAVNRQMARILHLLPARACDRLVRAVREWEGKRVPVTEVLESERSAYLTNLHNLYEGKYSMRRLLSGWSPTVRWNPRWLNLRQAAREGEAYYRQLEKEWRKPIVQQKPVPPPEHRIFSLLGSVVEFVPSKSAWNTARTRLLACAAAVRAYRLKNGTYPSTLQEAGVADLNNDPFTGEQFVYKPAEGGFLLYSVGEDGRDDGGWRAPENVTKTGGDVALIPYRGRPLTQGGRRERGEPVLLH